MGGSQGGGSERELLQVESRLTHLIKDMKRYLIIGWYPILGFIQYGVMECFLCCFLLSSPPLSLSPLPLLGSSLSSESSGKIDSQQMQPVYEMKSHIQELKNNMETLQKDIQVSVTS